jgi:hypothetical protein
VYQRSVYLSDNPTMRKVHQSLVRLMEAARTSPLLAKQRPGKKVETHSDLADVLGASDQVISNWASRGVSKQGALRAGFVLGCSPTFVLEGAGTAFAAEAPDLVMYEAERPVALLQVKSPEVAYQSELPGDIDWHTLAVQVAMGHTKAEVRSLLLDFVDMVSAERTRLMQAIAERAKQHTPKGAKG